MAWRIAKSVLKGELDNRVRGAVSGRIWLLGRQHPVRLKLTGNALEDVAGRLLTFVNPRPQSGDPTDLTALQDGGVGDITASRKVYALDCTVEEAMRLAKEDKEVPKHLANGLYIEWFSQTNGRVVIESTDFEVHVSDPVWTATPGELSAQAESNKDSFLAWMERLDAELSDDDEEESDPPEVEIPEDRPLNEFEWEKLFRESDKKTERLGEIMEKYRGHPDADKLIAREMGWTWMEEAIEAQQRGYISSGDEEDGDADDIEPLEPNPLTEGRDWIRDEDGDVHHPIALKAFRLAMRMWHFADEMGVVRGDARNETVHQMVFQIQCTSAKLAGALNSLAYDRTVDHGFVVAGLKRALNYLHASIQASDQVLDTSLLPKPDVERFRNELFGLREDVITLMNEHRRQIGHG